MTPWVSRLLIANILMFGVQYLAPELADGLVYVPALIFSRPWALVTYMFLHGSFTHVLFNMLGLYFFGPRLEERLGSDRFITMYLIAGVSGALLSSFFAPRAALIGASAGVFGVMLGFAMNWPRERIYIWGVLPVEARVMVVVMTVLAVASGLKGSTGGIADFAHLGGFAGAFAYLMYAKRFGPAKQFAAKVHAPGKEIDRRFADGIPTLKLDGLHEMTRDEIARLVEQVKVRGPASLSPQERSFLSNFVQ